MSSSKQLAEQVLILRCQIGDRYALAELIRRHERPLRYFIVRLLGDSAIAEDVFQDTWLAVIRRICTLRKVETFTSWLYRIARNRVYQELRKKKYSFLLDEDLDGPDDTQNDVFLAEEAAKVHKCLEKLQPEHKEVLMLRFLEQMSYEQISGVINCTLGTVRSRIYYAKRALKRKMEE